MTSTSKVGERSGFGICRDLGFIIFLDFQFQTTSSSWALQLINSREIGIVEKMEGEDRTTLVSSKAELKRREKEKKNKSGGF